MQLEHAGKAHLDDLGSPNSLCLSGNCKIPFPKCHPADARTQISDFLQYRPQNPAGAQKEKEARFLCWGKAFQNAGASLPDTGHGL